MAGTGCLGAVPCRAEGAHRAAVPAYRAATATHGPPGVRSRNCAGAAQRGGAARDGNLRSRRATDGRHRPAGARRTITRRHRGLCRAWISRDLANLETPGVRAERPRSAGSIGRACAQRDQARAALPHCGGLTATRGGCYAERIFRTAASWIELIPVESCPLDPPAVARCRCTDCTQPAVTAAARHCAAFHPHDG